jgi:hypothetical protein
MSKLPSHLNSLKEYDGLGYWFKIYYLGVKDSKAWATYGESSVNFTIPASTPPGKYLLRVEQFWPSASLGQSQHYISCAHVEVVGEGVGEPGPLIKFPDGYEADSPSKSGRKRGSQVYKGLIENSGIWFHEEGSTDTPEKDLSKYVAPEPPVWQG